MVNEAIANGARKTEACRVIGLPIRTLQHWVNNGVISADRRPTAKRPEPYNKLSAEGRQKIVDVCNEPEFADITPNQIVPTLADRGIYLASESTFYRVLKSRSQLVSRKRAKTRGHYKKPCVQKATAPNHVWTWDISYLPGRVKGQHYYLYMILDIFSRKIVGAEVYTQELGEHAADLLQRTAWAEKCVNKKVVLHSDNGAPMRSFTMLAKMQDLGVISSYSRPRVSNDNPYSEALFKTVKYCPQWPLRGFWNVDEARDWVDNFVGWYNTTHKHSGIKYVTPEERHKGLDIPILSKRDEVYQRAKSINPERWSRNSRNWDYINEVQLNPEKEAA